MKPNKQILSLTTVLLASTAIYDANAGSHDTTCDTQELVEAGTLTGAGQSVGFIIGARWADGVVRMNNGTTFKFKAKGGKGMEVGVAAAKFSGTVYNLEKPEEFAGTYSGMSGAVTAVETGAGFAHYTNGNCVVLKVKRHDPSGVQAGAPMLGVVQIKIDE